MHRVKATQVQSRKSIYIDLDACPLIVRGSVTEKIEGKPERTLECTVLYFAATTPQGGGLVEYVDETPEELFGMQRVQNIRPISQSGSVATVPLGF